MEVFSKAPKEADGLCQGKYITFKKETKSK